MGNIAAEAVRNMVKSFYNVTNDMHLYQYIAKGILYQNQTLVKEIESRGVTLDTAN